VAAVNGLDLSRRYPHATGCQSGSDVLGRRAYSGASYHLQQDFDDHCRSGFPDRFPHAQLPPSLQLYAGAFRIGAQVQVLGDPFVAYDPSPLDQVEQRVMDPDMQLDP
jgi:hypothetical protein